MRLGFYRNKGGQRRDSLVIEAEAITDIVPARQAEVPAGLYHPKHGVAPATIPAHRPPDFFRLVTKLRERNEWPTAFMIDG